MKASLPRSLLLLFATAVLFSNHGARAAPLPLTDTEFAAKEKAAGTLLQKLINFPKERGNHQVAIQWKDVPPSLDRRKAKDGLLNGQKNLAEDAIKAYQELANSYGEEVKKLEAAAPPRRFKPFNRKAADPETQSKISKYSERKSEMERQISGIQKKVGSLQAQQQKGYQKDKVLDAYNLHVMPAFDELHKLLSAFDLTRRQKMKIPRASADAVLAKAKKAHGGIKDFLSASQKVHSHRAKQKTKVGQETSKVDLKIGSEGQNIDEALERLIAALQSNLNSEILCSDAKLVVDGQAYFKDWYKKWKSGRPQAA